MSQKNTFAPGTDDAAGLHEANQKPETADQQQRRPESSTLSDRQYLDQTVGPILVHALHALAQARPMEPLSYLATYLLNHKHFCPKPAQPPGP